jgi:hypothetical protein
MEVIFASENCFVLLSEVSTVQVWTSTVLSINLQPKFNSSTEAKYIKTLCFNQTINSKL